MPELRVLEHERLKKRKMIYYPDRQIDTDQPSCLSLGATGRFIAIIEIIFYTFVFYTVKDYFAGEKDLILCYFCVHLN